MLDAAAIGVYSSFQPQEFRWVLEIALSAEVLREWLIWFIELGNDNT